MRKFIVIFILAVIIPSFVIGQEFLIDLGENPILKKNAIENSKHPRRSLKEARKVDPLFLPFFENFRQEDVYPNPERFCDSNVFINNTWSVAPLDRGVATFDVLNKNGEVYSHAISNPFIADYLTSQPIRTDELSDTKAIDSLTFYFFYQPQGRGNAPEAGDSLVLQFLADSTVVGGQSDSTWVNVWSTAGLTLEEFKAENPNGWGTVRIDKVKLNTDNNKDAIFFHKKFRFRFYNYGSLEDDQDPTSRSNVDQWHVDLIRLSTYDYNDKFSVDEVSFSEAPQSFLRGGYQSVPYLQYVENPNLFYTNEFENYIANLSRDEIGTNYTYEVSRWDDPTIIFSYDGLFCNLRNVYDFGFQDAAYCRKHVKPSIEQPFPYIPSLDSATFLIKHNIKQATSTSRTGIIQSDEVIYKQHFYNYYAFDKGVPEKGYQLIGTGAKLGIKFDVPKADSIRGIYMYFNHTVNDAQQDINFDIAIWREGVNKPGEEIILMENQRPKWDKDNIYNFVRYDFDKPVYLTAGTYYVGWVQPTTAVGGLNVGFDTYINNKDRIFYNVDGSWVKTSFEGTVMIRPIVGMDLKLSTPNTPNLISYTKIYPNPTKDILNIELNENLRNRKQDIKIIISNVVGQRMIEQQFRDNINVSMLDKGMYLVTFIDESNNTSSTKKLIITD
ncbi:MAG: T9SS type A sorting domain-containing protein [Hyphomicrobiales bacterium]